MTTITKERIELFIKNPLDNGLTRGEQMELARIALASLEAEPVAVNDDMAYAFHHALSDSSLGADEVEEIKAGLRAAFANVTIQPEPVVPAVLERLRTIVADPRALPRRKEWVSGQQYSYVLLENVEAMVDEACRAAMLQSGNFRENKNSSTNNFREIAETSTNYPVIPSEVLSAIQKVAKIRADFDDFDGDRRGIGDCLDEAEQELIVTINKYASQLAAEPIAPNDVREQTAIPQVPVTPDGWISCSERMPGDGQHVIILCDGTFVLYAQYRDGEFFDIVRNGDEFFETQSRNVTDWMPLPEPPQESKSE
ncbi:TPA: DUF551 domain-containing protein [Escherichia coli]|nr:DUF551 domain-containing protein [Escherichia coli]